MADELRGKVVLIAGATGALGSAVAREFATTGASLVLAGRSEGKLDVLVSDLGLPPEQSLEVAADVTQSRGVGVAVTGVIPLSKVGVKVGVMYMSVGLKSSSVGFCFEIASSLSHRSGSFSGGSPPQYSAQVLSMA